MLFWNVQEVVSCDIPLALLPCCQILESTAARDVLTATEQLVLLVAALCHDLDHDGHTNSFHINAGTELAQRFNDRSGG